MKKKIGMLSALLMSAMLVFGVAGCGQTIQDDPNTLYIWTADLDASYEAALDLNPDNPTALFTKELVEGFEESHPGKTVSLLFNGWGEELNGNMMKLIGSQNSIKVDLIPGEEYMPRYVQGGVYAPIELDDITSDMVESIANEGVYEGETYAIPTSTGTFALYVNHTVLKEAGILNEDGTVNEIYSDLNPLEPATWEDLLAICEVVKQYYESRNVSDHGGMAISGTKTGSHWRALAFMRTAGGDFADEEGNVTFESQANRKAFNMMKDLVATGPDGITGISDEDKVIQYFVDNKAAYILDGGTILNKPIDKSTYSLSELPTYKDGGVKSGVATGTVYYSIWGRSTKKELALEFLRYWLSPEIQKRQLELTNRLSARTSVMSDESIHTEQYNWWANEKLVAPLIEPEYVNVKMLPCFINNPSHIWSEWQQFFSGVIAGNGTVENSIAATQSAMAKWAAQE